MSEDAPRILCVGSLALNDTVHANGHSQMALPGGNALYSAIGAQFTGINVSISATVGQDWPSNITEHLVNHEIDCSLVGKHEQTSLRAWVIYEDDGQRRYLLRNPEVIPLTPNPLGGGSSVSKDYFEAASAVHAQNSPRASSLSDGLGDFAAVHLCPMPISHLSEWLQLLKKYPKILVSLDIPPLPSEFSLQSPQLARLLERVDIFMPSEAELSPFRGDSHPEAFAQSISQLGPKLVVLKLGKKGAWMYSGKDNSFRHVPPAEATAIDPTGAGDSFCGAFLASYVSSRDTMTAAASAASAASIVVESFDAREVLVRPEIDFTNRQRDILQLMQV